MQDSKGRETGARPLSERQSEATNDETLSEIERDQKVEDPPKNSDRQAPAPDAQPDQPRKDRDDAGPM